jgi:hypothetical protein
MGTFNGHQCNCRRICARGDTIAVTRVVAVHITGCLSHSRSRCLSPLLCQQQHPDTAKCDERELQSDAEHYANPGWPWWR